MGIEPTLSAWEAEVLPLNYTRFELADAANSIHFGVTMEFAAAEVAECSEKESVKFAPFAFRCQGGFVSPARNSPSPRADPLKAKTGHFYLGGKTDISI